jgi:hypothetical protein
MSLDGCHILQCWCTHVRFVTNASFERGSRTETQHIQIGSDRFDVSERLGNFELMESVLC